MKKAKLEHIIDLEKNVFRRLYDLECQIINITLIVERIEEKLDNCLEQNNVH